MEEGKSDQKIATEVVESNVLNKLDPLCSGDFSPSNPVTTTSHEPEEGSEIGSDNKIPETSTEAPSSSTKLNEKNEIGVFDQYLVKIGVSEAYCSKSDLGNNEKVFKIDESDLDVNSILKPVPEEVQSSVIDPDSQDEDIVLKWDHDDECMADLTDTQLPAKEDSVKTNEPQDNEEVVSANNEISSNAEEVSGNFVNTTKDPDYNEISNSADENNSSKEDVLSQIDSILEQDKNIVSGNDKISAICKKDTENMEVSDQSDENLPTELILAATELVEAEETLRKAQFKEANDNTDSTSLKLDDTCLDRPSSDEHHKADNIDGKNDEIDKKKEEISVDIDIITDKTQVKETIEDNNMDVDTEKVAVKTDNVVDAALDVSNSNYMETVANSTVIDSTKENNIENENLDTTAITSDTLSNSASLDPIDHGLKQPNFMIEIPTQELINLSDNSVESDLNISLGNTEKQEENTIEPSLKEETDNKDVKENIIEDLKERNSADIEVQKSSKNVDDREPDFKEELVDIKLKEIKSPPCMMSSDDPQIEVDNEQELSKELEQNIQLDCKVSDTKESQVEIEKAQNDAQTVVKDVLHIECEPVEDKLPEIVEKPEINLEKTDQKTEQDSVINQHKEINLSTVFSSTDTEQQKIPITMNEIETIKEADCKIDTKSPSKPAEDSEIDIETFLKETRPLEPQIDDVPNEEIDDLLFEDDSPPDFNDDKDITMNASVLENIIEKLDSSIENKPVLKTDEVTDINISTEEATEIKNEAEQKQEIDQAAMETESELDKEKTTPTNLGTETISTETSVTKEGIETSTDKSSKDVSSVLEASISKEAEKEVPESSKTSVESSKTSCGEDVQPSTSQATSPLRMEAVSSEDVAEVTDSLGLLAEFRAHDDQDSSGQDDSDGDGDGDGSGDGDADGDYQDDEGSNQMMIDQSEDSAQHSENDLARPSETETEDSTDQANKDLKATDKEFNFAITSVVAGKEALAVADDDEEVAGDNIVELEDVVEEAPVSELILEQEEVAGDNIVELEDDGEEAPVSEFILEQLDVEVVAESTVSDAVEEPVVLQLETIDQLDVEVVAESTVSDAVEEPVVLQLEPIDKAATEAKTSRVPTPSEADEASTDLGVVDLGEISSEDDAQEERKTTDKDGAADDTATSTKGTASSPTQVAETAAKEATPALTRVTEKEDKSKSEVVEQISLDSDEETMPSSEVPLVGRSRCVNSECRSGVLPLYRADSLARAHYHARRKNGRVCRPCLDAVLMRAQSLIADVKDFKPLLSLDMGSVGTDLVEISDSSSDSEGEEPADDAKIGILGAKLLEKELAGLLNDTWVKYRLDERMQEAEDELNEQIKQIEDESAAVDAMLSQCQQATDELRNELYAAFETPRRDLPALSIFDTPNNAFCSESPPQTYENKRRLDSAQESLAKRRAGDDKDDDKEEVSVVQLSGETAPPSLPPAGEMRRPPIAVGMQVYAMRNAFGSWIKARVLDVTPKPPGAPQNTFSTCKVKFENKTRTTYKTLSARCLAYNEPSAVRMTIGTRLIALFKDSNSKGQRVAYYSGVVAEVPNPVNKYRYLVFFDDGYAQYVQHSDTRLVCESSSLVWEEVHPFSREFVKEYLLAYPERPMVRLHPGQNIKTEWNGKWWTCRVVSVDASLVQVFFSEDKRIEWIYRGSTRLAPLYLELQAGRRQAANVPRRLTNKNNMPYVEYTRSEEAEPRPQTQQATRNEELRRQRAVAKKSTVCGVAPPAPAPPADNLDAVTSRVVYYTPKNAVRPHKMVPHTCSARCKRTDVLALKDLRTYNPLAKPLLSGWERQLVRYKGHKEVVYRAPCGRRLRNMKELHRYLRVTSSDMAVDLFDFSPLTHCLAEFVLNKCIVGKKDLSHSKENVPVPCVNYYDDSLPEFCSYNTERTPTAGVPLNLDPDFLCGCDCTDDCEDKSKCACWQMTLEGARTIGMGDDVGYVYKRLPEPLPSGIYECNIRCKCKQTCLNRVAQHPLQLKLQVFKTLNRGWGIRALNDVPKGSFLCIYAGNLLTDATANLDGLNEGDEYLAELDYIEVVEQMKEGYEEDVPEHDKKLDEKDSESESESEQSEEESPRGRTDEDGDFQPAFNMPVAEFSKRLRKREKKKQKDKEEEETKEKKDKEKDGNTEEDCITISDDEELREPARFAAQAGPGEVYAPKYRSVRSYFGKDEACYIMDAKVQGNIGRYLNHSCSPNVFVQNVFVDTHDPRFPWVAFFALAHIRAGTELTWNYNYDVGSVPGKALYCYCGSHNCRGRLL